MQTIRTSLFLLFLPVFLWAQPSNDECIDAIEISTLDNWCSAISEFSNIDANQSPEATDGGCVPNTQDNDDVWFKFTAIGTDISISVVGDLLVNPGGSLSQPQFVLYSGVCGNLVEEACASDNMNNNQVSIITGPLTVGEEYYIQVGARFGKEGTFELCINNFNAVPSPSGDCEPGVILCDKSPFSVALVSGSGNQPNELFGLDCVDPGQCSGGVSEFASSWYKWTCEQSGTLSFSIDPLNPSDDIDFVIFELPNGINDCSNKIPLRCMFSGENVGAPLEEWQACTGSTGLALTDPDDTEACGCQPGDNNFAVAINMVAGRSYALVIMNFSESGNGFSIEWGGTGTFLGPTADYTTAPNELCVGEEISFTDQSSFIGNIIGWEWDFGLGASPASFNGQTPPPVIYNVPGTKIIRLTIETERGCFVTKVDSPLEVICCDDYFDVAADITNVECPDTPTGAIDLTTSSAFGPIVFSWDNGADTEDISGIIGGDYMITLTDESTCTDSLSFVVDGPPPIVFDTLIVMPTCNGGMDGVLTLNVSGATPPYLFSFEGGPFDPNNTWPNLAVGDYDVTVRDANGCEFMLTIPVRELELTLDPNVVSIEQPSCFGFSDGSITVSINNGLPPYEYDFNDGNGFQSSNILNNLPAGVYQVDVRDANLCLGSFTFDIEDHPPLTLNFVTENVSCFGLSDGSVMPVVTGGVGNYSFSWSSGQNTADLSNIIAGNYVLTVTDGNGCIIEGDTTITEPGFLGLDVTDIVDNICFGESEGSVTVQETGGVGPYEYSADGFTFQTSPVFNNLPAGDYTFVVLDANDCTAEVNATISQPIELIVDAGPDRLIQLGFDTLVVATSNYSPVTYTWSSTGEFTCLNSDCSRIEVRPFNTTVYEVTVINEDGCTATDIVTIRVIKDRPVYIPNVFSPNGDGVNDNFTVFSGPAAAEIRSLRIYNRWGGLVYEEGNFPTNDTRLGWDGTQAGQAVNSGVFVYVAEVAFIDGEVVQYEGDVTVLR